MNKVGDHDVSPYLTQRLRSIEEVQAEREQRRRDPAGDTTKHQAKNLTTEAPKTPATDTPKTLDGATRPGQILDEKA